VRWAEYGQDLEGNLQDLHERVRAGRYRAKPTRRAYIPTDIPMLIPGRTRLQL
jgi:retron-type reverse transcriptase